MFGARVESNHALKREDDLFDGIFSFVFRCHGITRVRIPAGAGAKVPELSASLS
jgi:hypothetical protein